MAFTSFLLLAAAQLAAAHFQLQFPLWRADALAQNTSYSEWIYPCREPGSFSVSAWAGELTGSRRCQCAIWCKRQPNGMAALDRLRPDDAPPSVDLHLHQCRPGRQCHQLQLYPDSWCYVERDRCWSSVSAKSPVSARAYPYRWRARLRPGGHSRGTFHPRSATISRDVPELLQPGIR